MNKAHHTLLLTALIFSLAALIRPSANNAYAALDDAPSIAVCALPTLINELMSSDRYAPAREAYSQELSLELNELNQRGRDLSREISQMEPEDPGAQEKFREIQQVRETLAQKQQENTRLMEAFTAGQIKECNDLVRSSARAVADDLGFVFVLSSADADEELADVVETLFRQITARPVIMHPEENDITSDVRDDLNLE